jgi:F0F1-type ATP synthase membrane subunit a
MVLQSEFGLPHNFVAALMRILFNFLYKLCTLSAPLRQKMRMQTVIEWFAEIFERQINI